MYTSLDVVGSLPTYRFLFLVLRIFDEQRLNGPLLNLLEIYFARNIQDFFFFFFAILRNYGSQHFLTVNGFFRHNITAMKIFKC